VDFDYYGMTTFNVYVLASDKQSNGNKRCWADEVAEYTFEGVKLFGPKDYDEYMTFKFGDYMNLPPESERKTHPISRLKLLE